MKQATRQGKVPEITGIYPSHCSPKRTIIPKGVSLTELLAWFASRTREPTADDIRVRFGCSRATAYRWRALWAAECAAIRTFSGQSQSRALESCECTETELSQPFLSQNDRKPA
jgi:hypothetical protein